MFEGNSPTEVDMSEQQTIRQCVICEKPLNDDDVRKCEECFQCEMRAEVDKEVEYLLNVYGPTYVLRALSTVLGRMAESKQIEEEKGILWRIAQDLNKSAEDSEALRYLLPQRDS